MCARLTVCLVLGGSLAQAAPDADALRDALLARDFDAAAEMLAGQADAGDATARYRFAGLLRRGLGVDRDDEQASALYSSLDPQRFAGSGQVALEPATTDWQNLGAGDRGLLLRRSAQRNDTAAIEALLAVGAAVDAASPTGMTALAEAAVHGHLDAAERLIAGGANVDAKDSLGDTPLILAAGRGHTDVVDRLVSAGANLDDRGLFKNTALIAAVVHGHTDTAESLLAHGADPALKNAGGDSPADLARLSRDPRISSVFAGGSAAPARSVRAATGLNGLQTDAPLPFGRELWFVAADRGNVQALASLLGRGADIDQADEAGDTALIIAARRGHTRSVALLLARGASAWRANQSGETAAVVAAASGRDDILDEITRLPSNPSPEHALDVLETAAASGNSESLDLLLDRGFPFVDERSAMTPALIASATGCQPRSASRLLDAGADANAADSLGRAAIWHASDAACLEVVEVLLEYGADPDRVDRNGDASLHRAARSGCGACARAILAQSQTEDVRNQAGWTPLMVAAVSNHFDVVFALAGAGHDVDARNDHGNSALLMNVARGNKAAVETLLTLGAKTRLVNKRRRNAFDLANIYGYDAILALLENH